MKEWFSKRAPRRADLIAAVDVGSSKVCCLIAQFEPGRGLQVIGIGHQMSDGVKGGRIVDLEAAQAAIGTAVAAAEQMAGEEITHVTISLSGGLKASRTLGVEMPLAGREVDTADIQRLMSEGESLLDDPEMEIVQRIPVGFSIDGLNGIRDPRGMSGHRLSAHVHVMAASYGPLRTLVGAVARCHLHVDHVVPAAQASGLSCLVEDERDLGCVLIDLGGGTTSFAIFYEGQPVFTDCIPLGGQHITSDIARGLTTPLQDAERLKILHGNALAALSDEREQIDVPLVGEEGPDHLLTVPKSALISIIRPRVEETLELIRDRIEMSGLSNLAGRRVVLTGGASQLAGLRELAHRVLDRQVRVGRPLRTGGLAEQHCGPAFATATGLLHHALQANQQARQLAEHSGSFARRLGWFRPQN